MGCGFMHRGHSSACRLPGEKNREMANNTQSQFTCAWPISGATRPFLAFGSILPSETVHTCRAKWWGSDVILDIFFDLLRTICEAFTSTGSGVAGIAGHPPGLKRAACEYFRRLVSEGLGTPLFRAAMDKGIVSMLVAVMQHTGAIFAGLLPGTRHIWALTFSIPRHDACQHIAWSQRT